VKSERLAGKIILVTGGAGGIGSASARCFVEAGATVIVADIDLAGAKHVADGDANMQALELDVTSDDAWKAAIASMLGRYGRLDALVNNAGIASFRDIETIEDAEWHRTMAVNVDGTFYGCRQAVIAMKTTGGGSIVNISSIAGIIGGRNTIAYNAAKGAVRLLTKSVALHCAHKKYAIRCNSVHPTFIETPMYDEVVNRSRDPEATAAALAASVPLGRIGRAHEVADMLLYLVSDESQFVTGSEFVIDGGYTAA